MSPLARIVLEYGDSTTHVVELEPDADYTLGRDPKCSIQIDEKSISRAHLLIRHDQKGWHLRNISNTNGIVFNGRLVSKLRPTHGDVFQLGRVTCTFAEEERLLQELAAQASGPEEEEGPGEGRETREDEEPEEEREQEEEREPEPEEKEPLPDLTADPEPVQEEAAEPGTATHVVESPQPIIVCPVCGSKVQIIDFATIEEISCHACAAQLGRLAIRHLESVGIFDSVMLKTDSGETTRPTIGEYRILAELGAGGMGKVFRGFDPANNQTVAVKLLHPRKGQEKTFAKAFENEARALARIYHKNIVKIFRFGMHGNVHYIAMEFVEGTSVKKMIEGRRKLQIDQVKEILRQSLVGLNHIHRTGIVHNDVKPSNILVDKNGEVKLVDFGIVQLAETRDQKKRAFAAGTVEYLSPEVIRGSAPTPQADLYALGVTLYFMLCGQRPFKGETTQETLRMHLEDTPPHPKKHREIPEQLIAIIARLMAKTPEERYVGATEVLDDLDAMDLGHNLNKKTLSTARRWKQS